MRWHDDDLAELRDHLGRMGLDTCPVCKSSALNFSSAPVVLSWRGFAWSDSSTRDAKTNVLFAFLVTCDLCAHMLLFHAEQVRRGNELRLVQEPE